MVALDALVWYNYVKRQESWFSRSRKKAQKSGHKWDVTRQ